MAAICSVCAEPFTNYMHEYAAVPGRPGAGPEGGRMSEHDMKYDALVVGSGIGGMESALKLGDMGYKVLVVEKEPSVGGKMILLSKVFPTLDCASCISTPKMGATIHHPNIDVLTYAEVEGIRGDGNGSGYHAKIRQKPKFVDEAACTGCRQCEMACNVAVPDEFNADMVSRRAAYIAFPQAVPKKAVIERARASRRAPTSARRASRRTATWRACAAASTTRRSTWCSRRRRSSARSGAPATRPARSECTRGELEGPLPIRRLKRFIADERYGQARAARPSRSPSRTARRSPSWARARPASPPPGSSRARATASRSSRRRRSRAACSRLGIPAYRLPNDVVDDDVANVTAIGVEIADRRPGRRPRRRSRTTGYDAVLVATGTHKAVQLRVPGEDLDGVMSALDFLADVKLGKNVDLAGKQGARGRRRQRRHRRGAHGSPPRRRGGRTRSASSAARRCPPTTSRSRRPRPRASRCTTAGASTTSPATASVRERRAQGLHLRLRPRRAGSPRSTTRASSRPSTCDVVIVAAGMGADTEAFGLETNGNRTLKADAGTLQTAVPHVFAAGDVVTGPTMITTAVGQGRRAAFMIDRYLQGAGARPGRLRRGAPGRGQGERARRGRTSTTGASRSSRTPR